jgi:hypothetical protein
MADPVALGDIMQIGKDQYLLCHRSYSSSISRSLASIWLPGAA